MSLKAMPYSHFVGKISVEGGPDPAAEFRQLLSQTGGHPKSIAWFATWHVADAFHRAGNSICVFFYHIGDTERIEAIVARVLSESDSGFPPEKIKAYYEPWKSRLRNWWPLGGRREGKVIDIVLTQFDSLADIPGCNWRSNNPATNTFVGNACFAGWKFDDQFDPLAWLQSLNGERA